MICPSCHRKINIVTADQIWNGIVSLDSDGELKIEQETCTNELDDSLECDAEFPRYYCGECGHFLTTDDKVVKKILKAAEK